MKRIHFLKSMLTPSTLCVLLAVSFGAVGFTACDDDNDEESGLSGLFEGSLANAPYEADAVKYAVTGNPEIGSIELTSSGHYLVMPPLTGPNDLSKQPVHSPTPVRHNSIFRKQAGIQTQCGSGNAKFGTFVKNDNGSYTLTGFGTIFLLYENQLRLTMIDGSDITLAVRQLPKKFSDDKLNNRFCRTWHPVYGKVSVYDTTTNQLLEEEVISSEDELEEELVDYIIISKFNTYARIDYPNGYDSPAPEGGIWEWTDKAARKFRWQDTWPVYESMDSGEEEVRFNNDIAEFYSTWYETEGERTYRYESVTRCKAFN